MCLCEWFCEIYVFVLNGFMRCVCVKWFCDMYVFVLNGFMRCVCVCLC